MKLLRICAFCFQSILIFSCTSSPNNQELPQHISFNFDIRPILSNNCYVCHGPDSSTRKADLRLDLREFATMRLEDGKKAIVPGNWRKSELVRRVSSNDPEIMMPPPEMKRHLNEKEVALIKKWIDEGARWEPYWAFIPTTAPQVPEAIGEQYLDNEIDNFIVNQLEAKQLVPADQADKPSLIRRLSFTLTGLPPHPDEVVTFMKDDRPGGYEKLVDHYLSSPRYGEHWARHWMDLVRYADTRGHEFDYTVIGAWQYRDYLIRAFNQDVPYDQLIREQLAGDLLESPRMNINTGFNESVIGTAFYCLSEGKHSPVDLKIDQSERIDNIIDVTSKTFQALTVACAKCHDHKFDPIPTTDYYSLYGMVESTRFTLTQSGFDQQDQLILDSLKQDHQAIREYIAANVSGKSKADPPAGQEASFKSPHRVIADFRDGSLNQWIPDGMAFTNALGHPVVKETRLVGLESGKASSKIMGKGLYGVLRSPGFILGEDSLLIRAAGKNSVVRVIIDNFQLIQDPIYGQLQTAVSSDYLKDYRIDLSMWKGHHAYIELLVGDYMRRKDKDFHDYDLDPEAWLEVEYLVAYDSTLAIAFPDVAYKEDDKTVAVLLQEWTAGRATQRDVKRLNQWFMKNQPNIEGLGTWQQDQNRRAKALYDTGFVVGVTDGDYIESPVFIRGSLQNLSKTKVPHRFLTAVSDTSKQFKHQGSGRLELASKISDAKNPLTARVMVNRIWHHVFGRGIVETVDNFGVQGKIPSHPKLLDYLAIKFINENWSVKKLVKYMVMSQAFRRSTSASPESSLEDPDNLWLQHYPIRRLSAESVRDAVLKASGRLDTTMYGPPVPIYLTEFLEGRGRPKQSGPLDGHGRRSVYQAVNRNFLSPMMLAFDMPVPFSTFGRRNVSNVPTQSLTMLNDPFIAEQAAFWADRMLKHDEAFKQRIYRIYLNAFSREPTEAEIANAEMFFKEQSIMMKGMISENKIHRELWKSYCHSVFNMKEFIFLI